MLTGVNRSNRKFHLKLCNLGTGPNDVPKAFFLEPVNAKKCVVIADECYFSSG